MKKNNEEQDYTTSEIIIECCIVITLQFAICSMVFTLIPISSILGSIIAMLFILISNVTSVTIADTITKIRRL